jgi:hypothetical protein
VALPLMLRSQPELPPAGVVFSDEVVPRIDICIDPGMLDWIYENVESYQEFHATFQFDNGQITETIENIGFRLRGNTSRYSAKKSFKVSFNTFEPGRKWYGLEKLNLNGEHNDPSVIRAKLCWDLLEDLGVPGSRSNHVELYINNNYHGLYINVEHIDEEFVKSRFGNNDGNLYKCLWPADLTYLGSNPDNYKFINGNRRAYDLKINTEEDDYSDLAHFIDVLNNASDEDFLCEIEAVFNIYDYIEVLALDVFTANWDGYIFNKNNFYLYFNTETGKFEYIPYDLDNTYGIDWFQITWATRNIYSWHQDNRPLYTRIMENDHLRDLYSQYIEYFSNNLIGTPEFTGKINTLKDNNAPLIADDPYYPMDYGFTLQDYHDSFDEPLGMHVSEGLFPYINTRKQSIEAQLESYAVQPVINYVRNNRPQAGENLKVRAYVEGLEESDSVVVEYSLNEGPMVSKKMFDDGAHWDGDPNDGIFGATLLEMTENSLVRYQLKACNTSGLCLLIPCTPREYQLIESSDPQLFINEFMASNTTTIADEAGEFDDWFEVYNGDDEAVWLGDKYLTDNLNNVNKWQMPDTLLEPGDFILFWADEDQEQGPTHTNFKLDADGEEIGIFDSESTGFFRLDSILYGAQQTDISYGRKPDGASSWAYFTNTTPGFSNILGNAGENHHSASTLSVFPNPVFGGLFYLDEERSFTLYDASGTPVLQKENSRTVHTTALNPGLYFLVTTHGEAVKVILPR